MGLAGWSGVGKTTLSAHLIARLCSHGLKISTVKHAHHAFDIDTPGKDSYRHRQAGAGQVLVSSANRWALMTEVKNTQELSLSMALAHLNPCDLVLVEGFKQENFPKLELHRPALGKPLLYGNVSGIEAIASDAPLALTARVPVIDLNDLGAIEAWVLAHIKAQR